MSRFRDVDDSELLKIVSDRIGWEGIRAVSPATLTADAMRLPDAPDIRFEGFCEQAFDVLEALRQRPHIDEYRKQKERIRIFIQEPFKRYRDDLVVNWVLPNRLDLETERNVFSRLLKNDFGAGGCHHHLWMSFYRTGRRRLGDVQLAHSLWPQGLYIVVYVGNPAPKLFKRVHRRITDRPGEFLLLLNPLLQYHHTILQLNYSKTRGNLIVDRPLNELPDEFGQARELAVRLAITREEVVKRGSALTALALESIKTLWPVYRYCLEANS